MDWIDTTQWKVIDDHEHLTLIDQQTEEAFRFSRSQLYDASFEQWMFPTQDAFEGARLLHQEHQWKQWLQQHHLECNEPWRGVYANYKVSPSHMGPPEVTSWTIRPVKYWKDQRFQEQSHTFHQELQEDVCLRQDASLKSYQKQARSMNAFIVDATKQRVHFQHRSGLPFSLSKERLDAQDIPEPIDEFLVSKNNKQLTPVHQNLVAGVQWEMAQRIIHRRGGLLQGSSEVDGTTMYRIEDQTTYQFDLSLEQLRAGVWSKDKGLVIEPLCRQILEQVLGDDMVKSRRVLTPDVTGHPLPWELDGYNAALGVAFEYQGHASHWDPQNPDYMVTSSRDAKKVKLCKKLNIDLIVIPPYKGNCMHEQKIIEHVWQCIPRKFRVGKKMDDIQLDYSIIHHAVAQKRLVESLLKVHGLELAEHSVYKNAKSAFKIKTPQGDVMELSYSRIVENPARLGFLLPKAEVLHYTPKAQQTVSLVH